MSNVQVEIGMKSKINMGEQVNLASEIIKEFIDRQELKDLYIESQKIWTLYCENQDMFKDVSFREEFRNSLIRLNSGLYWLLTTEEKNYVDERARNEQRQRIFKRV